MALWGQLKSGEAAPLARESLRRALALDPNLASAHAAQGWAASMFDGSTAAAEASFRRALTLDPGAAHAHSSYSIHLLAIGCFEESLRELRAELELDPRSQATHAFLAWVLFCSRRFDEALDQARRAVEIDPAYPASHDYLGAIAGHLGVSDEALVASGKAVALGDNLPTLVPTWGYVCARAGRRDEARQILEHVLAEGKGYATPSRLAAIAVALGERDGALGWLERAVEQRCVWLRLSLVDLASTRCATSHASGPSSAAYAGRMPQNRPSRPPLDPVDIDRG